MIIPATKKLKDSANSAQILNYIRQNQSEAYKAAVPKAEENVESVRAVGEIILAQDTQWFNSFVPALINRIGRVVIQSKLYHNVFEPFKLGYMELGDVVEEIFVNLLDPHLFDPEEAGEKWMKREKPDVDAVFHRINFQAFYKITISYDELRAAFTTWSGLHDLVGRIIEQAYTSANWDEFIMFKYLMATVATKKLMYPVEIDSPTAANVKGITTQMVALSNSLTFMDGSYNSMGVPTYTNKENQLMIINAEYSALQDVEVLSAAFNMDKAELQGHVILVNSFTFSQMELDRLKKLAAIIGTPYPQFTADELAFLDSIPAMLLDESFFIVIDQLFEMRNQENGQGLYWQYWLHCWKLFSWSPFANAVLFTTEATGVTSVTVTPKTATVKKGATYQFNASVVATGGAGISVRWSVSGTDETTSSVDANGLLSVAAGETNSTLTVTATSVFDSTKTASATVTVSA